MLLKTAQTYPEEAIVIQLRTGRLRKVWEQLTEMLNVRDAKLKEGGSVHRFLKDLDYFQSWLSKTESDITNRDSPASLDENENLVSTH